MTDGTMAAATYAVQTIDAALLHPMTATMTPISLVAQAETPTEHREERVATATPGPLATPIIIIIIPTSPVNTVTEQHAPTTTPDLAATAKAEEIWMATALAATLAAQPTATPDLLATATAETKRLVIALAETLTAQPTATATPDLAATQTTMAHWLAKALAETLTAQPTITPTSSATPNFAATQTAMAHAMATAVAATLTAQPTATPLPSATWTPAPTATPTPDFRQLIVDYRRAERAALQTLDPNVLAQLPVFTSGEALAAINQQVEALRAAGQYQILVIEEIQVMHMILEPTIGVLTQERHTLQTFTHTGDGDRLAEQEMATMNVVYGIGNEAGRWKINRVRLTKIE
ncbi:MAG: hypothetical protein KF832_18900 [Caldilineaceae bacterium]|nr:hypothetical protein [Caldilineaceae bacterium]